MLTIAERRAGSEGELWITDIDRERHRWLRILPQLVAQEIPKWPKGPFSGLQRQSDLGLGNFPLYMCQVPSVFFFPYITYTVEKWPTMDIDIPAFMIPQVPLNRLEGQSWLRGSAFFPPFALINPNPQHKGLLQAWINSQGEPVYQGLAYLEATRRATAAQIYLLDSVRHVYDEEKSKSDKAKTSEPTRYRFAEETAEFANTKVYIEWHLDAFNEFVDKFVTRIKSCTNMKEREQCLVGGWTINRLAIDAFVIMSVDIPYARKWQFFGFLDALASLRNELDGTNHNKDKQTAQDMLTNSFFDNELLPILEKIPVTAIRETVIDHTKTVYDAIDQLEIKEVKHPTSGKVVVAGVSGPELLWAYRNSRHGYTLKAPARELLLLDEGIVPSHLPDLTIALWHYVLMGLSL